MSPIKKPNILLDFNILLWIPDVQLTTPKKFDRAEEQRAFSELDDMRSRGRINISIPSKLPESIRAKLRRPENKEKVRLFFKGIPLSETIVMIGSDLEQMENRALDELLSEVPSNKTHDDPALFILAKLVLPNVTHLATCDMKFIKTIATYDKGLLKAERVEEYIKFRRKHTELMVNLPSEILRDLQK